MSNALAIVQGTIQEAREGFAAVLADRSISFEREAGFAVQILSGSDYALGIATKNRQSVIDAVTNIAAIGISLNPAKKQAYLVPRKGKICLDISYIGLLDLAVQSGSILWGQAELVYSNDLFKLRGFDQAPLHEYNPFGTERGAMIGVYVVVKTSSGDYLTTTMSIAEVDGIKLRSESVKSGKSSPWDTDYGEMAKKTVIKRASKLWPKTARLDQAIHYLNTEGEEGLGFNASPAKAMDWVDVIPMIAAATQTKTDDDALAYWKGNNAALAKQPADHAKLKEAVMAHRTALKEKDVSRTVEMPSSEVTPDAMQAFDESYIPE